MGTGFTPFTTWVWALDRVTGVTAVEFAINFPTSVIASTVTVSPLVSVGLGTITAGTTVAFLTCQNDWVWTHQVACYDINTVPSVITIIPDPTAIPPDYLFARCDLGMTAFEPTIFSNLYLNQACVIATQSASWGAIKSLF